MKIRRRNRARSIGFLSCVAVTLAAGAGVPHAAEPYSFRTVANSATAIPGALTRTFSSFNQPSINTLCTVVFRARGTGPGSPPRGVYRKAACQPSATLAKVMAAGDTVPYPNNLTAPFNEFPAFARIDPMANFLATRGQSRPVWEYVLPDGSDTRVGTAGVYTATAPYWAPVTGASQLGAVTAFAYFAVPGFDGVRFDQFPGAPAPFGGRYVAFKGNFTDGTTARTGVYFRDLAGDGRSPVRKIADSTTPIPNGTVTFGSTAPPSAALNQIVFVGLDNEDAPTQGGIYRSTVGSPTALTALATVGGPVPGVTGATFASFGEGLSFDGTRLAYWGSWGSETRQVTLHCPADGNADLIDACEDACPDIDAVGHYCVRQVPVNQGFFVRGPDGVTRLVARAGTGQEFSDFLFWVFSGRPPGTGSGDETDIEEPPRWRASAFVAVSAGVGTPATAFKAAKPDGEQGIYMRPTFTKPIKPVVVVGEGGRAIDPQAPAASVVSSVGIERDGFRNCRLVVNAGFLDAASGETWAGVYLDGSACRR